MARKMLDEAGYKDVKIVASGDIDEHILMSLATQNACIDSYGIGTKLITSMDCPSLGGVYKMSAIENEKGELVPKLKMSDTPGKITNPGFKKIVRIYDKNSNKAIADLIALHEEKFDNLDELEIFDPNFTYKRKTITNFYVKELTTQIISKGQLVYDLPNVKQIAEYHKEAFGEFWNEYKRLMNPHIYKVDLSQKLYDLKQSLLKANSKK